MSLGLLLFTGLLGSAKADWPQINGPHRNGHAIGEKLRADWPQSLQPLWRHPVGQGYAGPVVQGDRVIVFHRPDRQYLVECLSAKTGEQLWSTPLEATYRGGGPDGDLGPKAVPLISKQQLVVMGTGGELACLSLDDGKVQWQKNVLTTYGSPTGYFGAGSSPIVFGDQLMVNVGGKDAAVVAFDLATGEERWKAFDDRASYSSPILVEWNQGPLAVFVTRLNVVGIDPRSGEVRFSEPFGARGPTVNAAMPVELDGHLFLTSAYGIGAHWFKLTSEGLKSEWSNDESFSSQYSTPVTFDGRLYGTPGREDVGNGSYRCIDPKTGKVLWDQPGIPVGHSIRVEDRILFLDSSGGLRILRPNATKLDVEYETQLFAGPARALPALSGGRLFARSNATASKAGELIAVQVGEAKGQ